MPERTIVNNSDDIFKDAVIVAAHPDDEILWFSSIITNVARIFICYIGHKSEPEWSRGRVKALAAYPLPNVKALNLNAAEVFDCGDWQSPQISPFGMKLRRKNCNKNNYKDNYRKLESRFRELLTPYSHVFTHNPWGEYGHEEHVQIFRVLESLQIELGFTLWVSNYVSDRSAPLMLRYMTSFDNHFICMPTNRKIAKTIRDLYAQHGCWTWYDGFKWCYNEAFLRLNPVAQHKRNIGRAFPVNFLDIDEGNTRATHRERLEKMVKRVNRLVNRFLKNQ